MNHKTPGRVGGAVVVLALAGVALGSAALSLPLCRVVPSYDVCRAIPLCAATRIESLDGPSWRCSSRLLPR